MPRRSCVPDELKHGPVTVAAARAAGITRRQLRSSAWRHLGHGRYLWAGLAPSEDQRLAAALDSLPPEAAFAGATAARLYGLEVGGGRRPEVIVPPGAGVSG
ncbi:MAG: hypothetical protein WAM30_00885, partial [Candidatus Dormiibacterota bacterium]